MALPGSSVTADPIARCSGSEAVRISRIVGAAGGLQASLTGEEADRRVLINCGTASAGARKVVVEMTLASIPFLADLEITVQVS